MTCFLTFLTVRLTFLTAKCLKSGRPFVRNVRFSDISDCARGEKSIFLSLSCVFATRARKQICQKIPTQIQRAPALFEDPPFHVRHLLLDDRIVVQPLGACRADHQHVIDHLTQQRLKDGFQRNLPILLG